MLWDRFRFAVEPVGVAVFAESRLKNELGVDLATDLPGGLDGPEKRRRLDGVDRWPALAESAADAPRGPPTESGQLRVV